MISIYDDVVVEMTIEHAWSGVPPLYYSLAIQQVNHYRMLLLYGILLLLFRRTSNHLQNHNEVQLANLTTYYF